MLANITDYLLYRRRFIFGYVGIGITVVILLIIVGFFIPGGISVAEMESTVQSSRISTDSFNPESIINLPYHLLQRASIDLLGVSNISIKLPSLILGALSIAGILILLQSWFKRNVAIITTALVITAGQLLFVAQNGTPSILYILWSVWLLVAAIKVSQQAKKSGLWKLTFFAVAALSLYTPLSIYILLALGSAIILHPHLRFIVKRLSRPILIGAAVFALVLLAPLGWAVVMEPGVILQLLGIPSQWPDLISNFTQLLSQYFQFTSLGSGTLMTPIYGLGSMVLIILGIYQLFKARHTARSYTIAAWLILLLPVLAINPRFISITFVPIMLLMGMGISIILSNWYEMFPRNPYARIAGLIPLAILIGGLVFSGLERYLYGYHYAPQTSMFFSTDLTLLNEQIKKEQKFLLIVDKTEKDFYQVVATQSPDITLVTAIPAKIQQTTIITGKAHRPLPRNQPELIVTSSKASDADRFYIYKTAKK